MTLSTSNRLFDEIQPYASTRKTVCYNMTDPKHLRTCSSHSVILLTTEIEVFIITDTVIIVSNSKSFIIIIILCSCHQSQIHRTRKVLRSFRLFHRLSITPSLMHLVSVLRETPSITTANLCLTNLDTRL